MRIYKQQKVQRRIQNRSSLVPSLFFSSLLLLLSLSMNHHHILANPQAGQEGAQGGSSVQTDADPSTSTSSTETPTEVTPKHGESQKKSTLTFLQPTKQEVEHHPPLVSDLLTLHPITLDQERCTSRKGRWKTLNQRLHGCVVGSSREGRWHLKEQNGSITLLAHFKADQLDGVYYEFYDTGRARSQGSWVKGKKDGQWLSWHSGGQIESLSHFQNDQLHGRYFSWFNTCLPQEWGAYEEGERQGAWRSWYMTGARQQEGNYVKGVQEGTWRFYHNEGNLIEEGEMRIGLREGTWQEWFHTGQAWRSVDYVTDLRQGEDQDACRAMEGLWEVDHKDRVERCIYQEMTVIAELQYYPSGALRRRMPYNKIGQHSGIDRRYHESGALLAEGSYVRGIPEGTHRYLKTDGEVFASVTIDAGTGLWVSYHSNGAIEEVGQYKEGMKVGVWRVFHDHVQGQSHPIVDPELALTITTPAGLKEELIFTDQGVLTGPYLSLYEDGTLSVKGMYEGGSRSGTWQFNYQNGQPAIEGNFQFGVRMGPWKEWHWMASPKMDGHFQFNRKDGSWKEYHNNGKLKAEGAYKRGQKEGPWKLYWYSGEPWRELIYRDGVAEDQDQLQCELFGGQWSEDLKERNAGCQMCQVTAEGTPNFLKLGTWRWWHPNGKLQTEGHFEGGERHGVWTQFDEEERKLLEGQYLHGKQVDRWRGFYPNTALKFEGGYLLKEAKDVPSEEQKTDSDELQAGDEDGVWYTFFADGSLESYGKYQTGKRIGLWLWWSQGTLSQVGAYHNGLRQGVWVSWHPQGGIRDLGTYQNGQRQGTWRWWKANGEPWRAQWYGLDKRKHDLPPPDPLEIPNPFEKFKAEIMAYFKGVNAQKRPKLAPFEFSIPPSPALSSTLKSALNELGID